MLTLTTLWSAAALAGAAVVPTREIAGGETLKNADVEWVDWPDELTHPDQITDPDRVIGRVTRVSLLPGEPLRDQRLYPRGHEGLTHARQLVTLPLAEPTSAWGPGTHLDLLAPGPGPACLLAQRGRVLEGTHGEAVIRAGGAPADALRIALPLHDAARIEHVVAAGQIPVPVARSDDDEALAALPSCGVLPADRIDLPPGGWSLGVDPPATEIKVDHPEQLEVREMGDPSWWHLLSRGQGPLQMVIRRDNQDPVLLDVVPHDRGGAAGRLHVPVGGALVLPLGAEVVYAHPEPVGPLDLTWRGEHLVLMGREPATVRVTARAADAQPRTWTIDVGEGWPLSREPELVIKAGRSRTLRLDKETSHAVSAAAAVALPQPPRGTRLKVRGYTPGRTTVVLFADDGSVITVRVVVIP